MPGKSVNGYIHAVPCPHCGKPNDCREFVEHIQNQGIDEDQTETGVVLQCDHCEKNMIVVAVKTVTLMWVRQP